MIGPGGFMAGPMPERKRECECAGKSCEPEKNEGRHCWRSGQLIPEGYFSESEGVKHG